MITLRPAVGALSTRVSALLPDPVSTALTPRGLDTSIPRDLETIILKARGVRVTRRYQSAGELADDLRRFLARLPIQARRLTWLEKSWMWCRRNPHLATLSGISAMLFLLVCLGVIASQALRHQRDLAIVAADDARRAELAAEQAEQDATVRKHLSQATSFRVSGLPGSRQGRSTSYSRPCD